MPAQLHPTLLRQLRRLMLTPGQAPGTAAFDALLLRVSRAYADIDQERYLLDRSQDIASGEMAALNAALKVSQQRLASLLSLSSDWVWEQDADGRFTYVSDDLQQRTGLESAALLGRACTVSAALACGPDEFARVGAAMAAREPFRDLAFEVTSAQGRLYCMRITGEPLFDAGRFIGYRGVGTDATAAVLADRRLHEVARRKLESQRDFSARLLEVSPTPLFVKDGQGRFVTVNQAWLALMNLTLEEVIGRTSFDLFGAKAPFHAAQDKRLRHVEDRVTYENRLERPGVDARDTVVTKVRLAHADDAPAGIVGSIVDVTEFRAAERRTCEARDAAEHANQAKSSFLANMSHEIRTPLTSIIGFAELLLDPRGSAPDKAGAAQTIVRNGRHLLEVINDILDLSKIETRQLELERIDVSLPGLLGDLRVLTAGRAQEKSLHFTIAPQLPLPPLLRTDPVRLKQILVNFCSNAIKFSAQGEVRVAVRHDPWRDRLLFEVRDNGIGMTEAQVARLFKPFTQADVSTTRQFGGSGLGLYISKQLADMLGADIQVESEPGVGSRFTLGVPVGRATPAAELLADPRDFDADARPAAEVGSVAVPALAGRVLLAEDGVDNQRLIGAYLRQAGVEADIVDNGLLAVEQAAVGAYALVLMDIQMPLLDGVAATERLRGRGYRGPIVALTANVMRSDVARYLACGFDDVLAKPIDRPRFYAVLAEHLRAAVLPVSAATEASAAEDAYERELAALTEEFRAGLPATLAAIESAAQAADWPTLKRLVHTLKGTAGSYGFAQITALAAEVEAALAADHDPEGVHGACAGLVQESRRAVAAGHAGRAP